MEKQTEQVTKKDLILDPKSKVSSMRWVITQIIPVISILLLSLPVLIAYQIYSEQTPDWVGVGAFLGGVGALLAPILGSKAWQKKFE